MRSNHNTNKAQQAAIMEERLKDYPMPDLAESDMQAMRDTDVVPREVAEKIKARRDALRRYHIDSDREVEPVWTPPEVAGEFFTN